MRRGWYTTSTDMDYKLYLERLIKYYGEKDLTETFEIFYADYVHVFRILRDLHKMEVRIKIENRFIL